MRRIFAIAICPLLLAACGPAQDNSPFGVFKSLCIDTGAGMAEAAAAAKQAGWTELPKETFDRYVTNNQFLSQAEKSNVQMRTHATGDATYLLVALKGPSRLFRGIDEKSCSIMIEKGEMPSDVFDRAQDFAAVEKQSVGDMSDPSGNGTSGAQQPPENRIVIYYWRDVNGTHKFVTPESLVSSSPAIQEQMRSLIVAKSKIRTMTFTVDTRHD